MMITHVHNYNCILSYLFIVTELLATVCLV